MRIAIINITGGGISGGYRKYLLNMIPRMVRHSNVESILCLSPKSLNVNSWFSAVENVYFENCPSLKLLCICINRSLSRVLKEFSPDVLFIPTERYFQFDNLPVVNMIQNMESFVYSGNKNPFSEKVINFLRKKNASKVMGRSVRIIAISKFVKEFLIDKFHIPDSNIGVVYHGVDDNIEDAKCLKPSAIPENWMSEFLFTAGSIRPARGLEDILYALNSPELKKHSLKLTIAGSTASNMLLYRNSLEKYILNNGLGKKVIWVEELNKPEMNWCYKNCKAFIMASRVEACPFVALESMSHGCISIAANNPPLPEIFGDTAVFYPPFDDKTLVETIQDVLTWDNHKINQISSKAKKRSATFTWDRTVEKTINELKMAIESHKQ